MPMTFPSHAAAVLPLKFWRRRHFDGVALVIGSAAPDFVYSLAPYWNFNAHSWLGLLVFCVPATMLLAVATRAAAPCVVAHVPRWRVLERFALLDYGTLAARRYPLAITAVSAWLGAASHRLWDLVTHQAAAARGTQDLVFLSQEAFLGQPWWRLLHYGSSIVGGLAVLSTALHIGRTGWLRADGTPVRSALRRPAAFWGAAVAVWVPGLAVQPFLAWSTEVAVIIVRLLELGRLGLLAGALACALTTAPADAPAPTHPPRPPRPLPPRPLPPRPRPLRRR